jgi:DNA mismatch repair protein MSH5
MVHAPAIGLACDTCAELDCLLCFAHAARTYHYVRPDMVEDNIIDVKQGRHPLQELVVDLYVPNDINLRGGEGLDVDVPEGDGGDTGNIRPYSIVVLTGANACGKVKRGVATLLLRADTNCSERLSQTGAHTAPSMITVR